MSIIFDHVSKKYDGTTFAVRDVNLTIDDGELMVFVGSSGCGKTTLLRMVNAMVTPTEGAVIVDGKNVAEENLIELRRSIGYVIQNGGLLPHWTVLKNIATLPKLKGIPYKQAKSQALECLYKVGLTSEDADKYPSELSGGQFQRVAVARALCSRTHILLMDEPFSAVDPIVRRELQFEVKTLQAEEKLTAIVVTHDINEALFLADRIALFRHGGILEQVGTPREILHSPRTDFVRSFIEAGRPHVDM